MQAMELSTLKYTVGTRILGYTVGLFACLLVS